MLPLVHGECWVNKKEITNETTSSHITELLNVVFPFEKQDKHYVYFNLVVNEDLHFPLVTAVIYYFWVGNLNLRRLI